MRVVADTSVLIALSRIGRLNLLRHLFTTVMVPRAVAEEYGVPLPEWIKVWGVRNDLLIEVLLTAPIHKGEAEAIALAIEKGADMVLLDDKKARGIARDLGLKVMGTLGTLILAKKWGIMDDLDREINELVKTSFYLSQDLVEKALDIARRDC